MLRAILDTWRDDLRWRVSRVKSRMSSWSTRSGPRAFAQGRATARRRAPVRRAAAIDVEPDDHLGSRTQPDGLRSVGVPVHVGLLGGARLVALADLLEPLGGEARITRQQNLLLANVPVGEVDGVVAALDELGLPLELERAPWERHRLHRRAALQYR